MIRVCTASFLSLVKMWDSKTFQVGLYRTIYNTRFSLFTILTHTQKIVRAVEIPHNMGTVHTLGFGESSLHLSNSKNQKSDEAKKNCESFSGETTDTVEILVAGIQHVNSGHALVYIHIKKNSCSLFSFYNHCSFVANAGFYDTRRWCLYRRD